MREKGRDAESVWLSHLVTDLCSAFSFYLQDLVQCSGKSYVRHSHSGMQEGCIT